MRSSMSPKPKRRPIPSHTKTPNHHSPTSTSATSSPSSTLTSLISQVEPPTDFLPSKSDFLRLFLVLVIAAAVGASCHFLSGFLNRPVVPFCDSDSPDSDYFLSDTCEPCPANGRCYNGQLECVQGYRKYGKLCIEDGEIYQKAKKLSEWTKDHLCEDYVQYMCEGTGAVWVSEDNLKNMLDNYGSIQDPPVDDAKYLYIKERAMEDINELLDTRRTSHGIKEFKCPDALAEHCKPMSCRVHQWVANNLLIVMAICALLAGCTLLYIRIRRRWHLTKRADQLYHLVCDTLEENAVMAKIQGDREPWLVASRLRDHLLLPRERRDPLLWKTVEELVESDSRLDRYPKLVKGDSKVVWEWQVEGSLSSSRRKQMAANDPDFGGEMKRSSEKKQQSVEIALDYNELRQMS